MNYGFGNNKNSLVIWENDQIMAVATGLKNSSSNTKTGGVIQTYILVKDEKPTEAVKSGKDALVCGNCPLRGKNGKKRACYVNVGQGPQAIYKSWKAGNVGKWNGDRTLFENKKLRWGSYGDSAFIPKDITKSITEVLDAHTSYTHQAFSHYFATSYSQVSCTSVKEANMWQDKGCKTARIVNNETEVKDNEILCPAQTEAQLTCDKCMLCNGREVNVCFIKHGAGKVHVKAK